MKLNLTNSQLDFLKKELGIVREDIEKMSASDWTNVREKCFDIEAEELYDLDVEEEKQGMELEESERCRLATSIVDIKYSQLKAA